MNKKTNFQFLGFRLFILGGCLNVGEGSPITIQQTAFEILKNKNCAGVEDL